MTPPRKVSPGRGWRRVKPHSVGPVARLDYFRTYGDPSDPKVRTHLEGIGDSYTLCGLDTAGDDMVHAKQPERIDRPRRITCEDCLQIMALVHAHDQANGPRDRRIRRAGKGKAS